MTIVDLRLNGQVISQDIGNLFELTPPAGGNIKPGPRGPVRGSPKGASHSPGWSKDEQGRSHCEVGRNPGEETGHKNEGVPPVRPAAAGNPKSGSHRWRSLDIVDILLPRVTHEAAPPAPPWAGINVPSVRLFSRPVAGTCCWRLTAPS